jgi:hypothetical protein
VGALRQSTLTPHCKAVRLFALLCLHRCPGRRRKGVAYLARNWKFESISLQRRVKCEDGLQLAQQLASEGNVPLIVTSGDIEKAEQAAEAGFVCFQKPFRLSDLAEAASKLLAGKAGGGEFSSPPRLPDSQRDRARRGGRASRG